MEQPIDPSIDSDRRRFAIALGVVAIAGLPAAFAAESAGKEGLYTIEIVIFRTGGTAAGEDLSAAVNHEARGDSDQGGGGSQRLGEVLPAARHKLGDVVARLNANGAKRVLAHMAWTQTASGWNSNAGVTAEQLGLAANGFSGLVSLERGQYLHLGFNLVQTSQNQRYTLAELRRVKLTERNYYDHPAIGIIAVVTQGG